MKFYYQTITTCDNNNVDEWIEYEGYDFEAAIAKREYEKAHNGKDYNTEVRAYRLPDERGFEDLDDDEQCAVLSSYDVAEVATTEKRQAEAVGEQECDARAFEDFEAADAGFFDGFDMADAFHRHYDKADAVETLTADDAGDTVTSLGARIHAGADGVTVYVMTEAARRGDVKKIVRFNRSVYAF